MILAHAAEVATEAGALPAAAIALAERSLVAMHQQDWMKAATLAEQAPGWFGPGSWTAMSPAPWSTPWRPGWPYTRATWHAPNNISRGPLPAALLTYALPYFAVQTLLELGRVCLALDDAAGARVVLRQARDILRRRPDLGILPGQADELWSKLDLSRGGPWGLGADHR